MAEKPAPDDWPLGGCRSAAACTIMCPVGDVSAAGRCMVMVVVRGDRTQIHRKKCFIGFAVHGMPSFTSINRLPSLFKFPVLLASGH